MRRLYIFAFLLHFNCEIALVTQFMVARSENVLYFMDMHMATGPKNGNGNGKKHLTHVQLWGENCISA